MKTELSRREMIVRAGVCLSTAATATATPTTAAEPDTRGKTEPFGYCLNTATLMGLKLSVDKEVEIAAGAGYRGIEPWMRNIHRYAQEGGSLGDLKKKIADLGLSVQSAIGFARWIVDDDVQRAEGLELLKRDMDLVAQIGGTRIAASPAGAHGNAITDLSAVARRYRKVLELGEQTGVVPQLEIWGSSKTLSRLGEAIFVAVEAAHPDACLLLDAYHLYRGGSDFGSLRLLNGAAMHVFHVNDYPADPPRENINDSHRVFPGDGVAPLGLLLRTLYASGYRGMLSLELFNPEYWKQDALTIAKTGLEKTRAVVRKAFG